MANQHHIVVWDPRGDYSEGSVVKREVEQQLSSRGVVLLPCEPKLFLTSGVGGYFSRHWGAGWPLDHHAPRIVCPMTLFVVKDHRYVHWAARLVPSSPDLLERMAKGEHIEGHIRFAADGSQINPNYPPISFEHGPISMRELKPQDAVEGGWVVRGYGVINMTGDAHLPFGLYGVAGGLRVAWAACSQAAESK